MSYSLGIIGAGQMAEAIVRGLLRAGRAVASDLIAADVSAVRRTYFQDELGVEATNSVTEVARQCETLLLSVKPYQMPEVLGEVGRAMPESTLVISIAAGVREASIAKHLGEGKRWRIVRTMPNTPMLVGEGMVALAAGKYAEAEDLKRARAIFEASADVIDVKEEQIDAVTAVSGSGPAYFFYIVEAMTRAGVEMGLSAEQSHRLASKTALGAAKMLLTSGDSPEELRRKVTTPNGTTHAAISHMESQQLGSIIVDGMKAAKKRSEELGA